LRVQLRLRLTSKSHLSTRKSVNTTQR
jgi:hypothetical protein